MKSGFIDRLIAKLDKVDPKSMQAQFLRLADERGLMEMIFQSIQEGIIVIAGNGNLNYSNRAAERMLGFSFDSMKGRSIKHLVKEFGLADMLHNEGKDWSRLVNHEIEITYPEHKHVNFYIVPLEHTAGEERGAVIILRDVTGERTDAAKVRESDRIHAIKLLAAGVAHEIGNPLNALNIHLQLLDREVKRLRDGTNSENDHEHNQAGAKSSRRKKAHAVTPDKAPQADVRRLTELVDVARSEVTRLDTIITKFLKAVRPVKPHLVIGRIESVLRETTALLENETSNRKISIDIVEHGPLPKVRMDKDQMKQAFFNVLRNSMQAMPDRGSISIALASSDKYVAISFKDSGEGIKNEDMGRIFDPYFTTKSQGSGLGLMIVQRIVQDHGGFMEIASKAGTGTTLTILLPLAERRIKLLPNIR